MAEEETGKIDGGLKSSIAAKAANKKQLDGMMIFPIPGEPRVKIIIEEQEGHEGSKPVKLGINGHVIVIMRGREVEVPESYVNLLKELKYAVYSKDDDGQDVEREVTRFNWRKVA
jgi:hypothetical protein